MEEKEKWERELGRGMGRDSVCLKEFKEKVGEKVRERVIVNTEWLSAFVCV